MTPAAVQLLPAGTERPRWLAARRRGIGGSDASAVVGLNPYRSAFAVYLDKLGQAVEREPSEAMAWGTRLEPVIASWFAEQAGLRLRRCGLLAHVDRGWQIVNPDRLSSDEGLVEIKATGTWLAREWEDEQVPDHAEIQVQHGMAVTGLGHAWVVGLIGGQRPVVRRVDRDEKLIAHLTRLQGEFWQRVLDRRPPDVRGDDRPRLSRARRPNAGTDTPLDPAAPPPLPTQRPPARAPRRRANRPAHAVAARLAALVGDAEYGTVAGRRAVQVRRCTRSDLDSKRLRAEQPDLAARYATSITYDQVVLLED